jgi:hypothetical protein
MTCSKPLDARRFGRRVADSGQCNAFSWSGVATSYVTPLLNAAKIASVYFSESGLFNELRPFGIKKSPARFCPPVPMRRAPAPSPLSVGRLQSSGFPSRTVYSGITGQPMIVGCNLDMAALRSKGAKDLDSTRHAGGLHWRGRLWARLGGATRACGRCCPMREPPILQSRRSHANRQRCGDMLAIAAAPRVRCSLSSAARG